MIMAEKIVTLRKRLGWSQEELAEKLGVSRQAVSKWEIGTAVPEADKIVALSGLLGVSTDYLLKDDNEVAPPAAAADDGESPAKFVSGEDARRYVALMRRLSRRYALAIALFLLSPIFLMIFSALSAQPDSGVTAALAGGLGAVVLLIFAAAGVALIVMSSLKASDFKYLRTAVVTLNPDVKAEMKAAKTAFGGTFTASITIGVSLCILAIVPLMLTLALEMGDFMIVCGACVMLAVLAVAVFVMTRAGFIRGSYSTLLMEDGYTAEDKRTERRLSAFPFAYWGVIIAVYLAVSFGTQNWQLSWIVWPIAGVLFFVVYSVLSEVFKKRK